MPDTPVIRPSRLSVAAWGRLLGISRQAAHQAVIRCQIPRDEAGTVDADEATRLYRSRTIPRAPNMPAMPRRPPCPWGPRPKLYTKR